LNETLNNILKEWDALDNEKFCIEKEMSNLENQLKNKKADILILVIGIMGVLLKMGVLAVTVPKAVAAFNTFQGNEKDIIRKQIDLNLSRIIALDKKCTQHNELIVQISKEKEDTKQIIDHNTADAKNIMLSRKEQMKLSLKQKQSYNHKLQVREFSIQKKLISHKMDELSIQKAYLEDKVNHLETVGNNIQNQKARKDNHESIKEEYQSYVQQVIHDLDVATHENAQKAYPHKMEINNLLLKNML